MSKSERERERQKALQEKCVMLLDELLRDEDNKYCVDCDAKGPRWASWNIGVFLCIRCAGIHRNLGVHVSRVKSVNLDTWLPDQVASLQQMGNSKARAIYEARLPDNFRRPQTDSALEAFIRSKYEHKKYIAEEWVPPKSPAKATWANEVIYPSTGSSSPASSVVTKPKKKAEEPKLVVKEQPKPAPVAVVTPQPVIPKSQSLIDDLLSLDTPVTQPVSSKTENAASVDALDIFGPTPAPVAPVASSNSSLLNAGQNFSSLNSLTSSPSGQTPAQNGPMQPAKMSKDAILALYQKSPNASSFQTPGFQTGFQGAAFAQPQPVNPLGMGLANGFTAPAPVPAPQPQGYSQQLIDQMRKLGMNAPVAPPAPAPAPAPNLGFQSAAFGVQPQLQHPAPFAPAPVVGAPQWGAQNMLPSGPASFPFAGLGAAGPAPAPAASYGQTMSKSLWQ